MMHKRVHSLQFGALQFKQKMAIAQPFLAFGMLLDDGVAHEEPRKRIFKKFINPMEYLTDENFIEEFRLSKEAFTEVVNYVYEDLRPRNHKKTNMSVERQILTALQFFATGCFLRNTSNSIYSATSKWSTSRCIHRVSDAIVRRMSHLIRMPQTHEEKLKKKRDFYEMQGIPGIIGKLQHSVMLLKLLGILKICFTQALCP